MAISYVASSSGTTSFSAPAGTANGDILIAVVASSSTTGTAMTWPTGWTPLATHTNGTGVRTSIAWFEWNTGDATSWTPTITGTSPAIACSAYRGVDPSSPIADNNWALTGADTTPTTATVNFADTNKWGVAIFTQEDALDRNMTAVNNSFVERVEQNSSTVNAVITDSNGPFTATSMAITGTWSGAPDGGTATGIFLRMLLPTQKDGFEFAFSDDDNGGQNISMADSDTSASADTAAVNANADGFEFVFSNDDNNGQQISMSDGDASAAVDTAAVTASADASDTGAAVDAATASVSTLEVPSADAAAAVDDAAISASLASDDSAAAVDSSTTTTSLADSDTGAADDAATTVALTSDDPALGLDDAPSVTLGNGDTGSALDSGVGNAVVTQGDAGAALDDQTVAPNDNDPVLSDDYAWADAVVTQADTGAALDDQGVSVAGDADTAAGVDGNEAVSSAFTDSDSGSGLDASTVQPTDGDSAVAVEASSTTASVSQGDTVAAAEGANPAIRLTNADTGVALDGSSMRTGDSDTASATESASTAATVPPGTDSAAAVDDSGVRVSDDDSGSAVDDSQKRAEGFLIMPRVIRVEDDNRTFRIEREIRTLTPASEMRKVVIGKTLAQYDTGAVADGFLAARTIKVIPDTRTFVCTQEGGYVTDWRFPGPELDGTDLITLVGPLIYEPGFTITV